MYLNSELNECNVSNTFPSTIIYYNSLHIEVSKYYTFGITFGSQTERKSKYYLCIIIDRIIYIFYLSGCLWHQLDCDHVIFFSSCFKFNTIFHIYDRYAVESSNHTKTELCGIGSGPKWVGNIISQDLL